MDEADKRFNLKKEKSIFHMRIDIDDEEEEEEEEEEDVPEEGFVAQTNIHDTTAVDIYQAERSKLSITDNEMDSIEQYVHERYGRNIEILADDEEQISYEITQQSLLPDVKSSIL
ncbi:unnamed protein product [Rotaria sp. Silwood1]|nr:unnamed protein product [Rotaria sp. Silwood1]CAF4771227.1 unnamed protein product [Rotaria sp. Silwood1]